MKNKTIQSEIIQRFMSDKEYADFLAKYKKARHQKRMDVVDAEEIKTILSLIELHGSVNAAAVHLQVTNAYINSVLAQSVIQKKIKSN